MHAYGKLKHAYLNKEIGLFAYLRQCHTAGQTVKVNPMHIAGVYLLVEGGN